MEREKLKRSVKDQVSEMEGHVKVISNEEFEKIQRLIEQPANPTPELVSLMSRK